MLPSTVGQDARVAEHAVKQGIATICLFVPAFVRGRGRSCAFIGGLPRRGVRQWNGDSHRPTTAGRLQADQVIE